MIPDLDIYRAANVIIKQYGQDAPIHAAMRADAMLEDGDLDGYRVYNRRRWPPVKPRPSISLWYLSNYEGVSAPSRL